MLLTGVIFSLAGYAQTSPAEKPAQEAQRRADAAKADVIITRKKNVFDSTTFNSDTRKPANKKTAKGTAKTKQPCKASAAKKQS